MGVGYYRTYWSFRDPPVGCLLLIFVAILLVHETNLERQLLLKEGMMTLGNRHCLVILCTTNSVRHGTRYHREEAREYPPPPPALNKKPPTIHHSSRRWETSSDERRIDRIISHTSESLSVCIPKNKKVWAHMETVRNIRKYLIDCLQLLP